jgi:hypothetical protein
VYRVFFVHLFSQPLFDWEEDVMAIMVPKNNRRDEEYQMHFAQDNLSKYNGYVETSYNLLNLKQIRVRSTVIIKYRSNNPFCGSPVARLQESRTEEAVFIKGILL